MSVERVKITLLRQSAILRFAEQSDLMSKLSFLHRGLVILGLVSSLMWPAGAQQPEVKPVARPKVALVFEGGGALGFAHIGVIDWMEQHHIPVDYVAGTSMGGLVGGLYASGMSPQEITDFVSGINWTSVLSGQVPFQALRNWGSRPPTAAGSPISSAGVAARWTTTSCFTAHGPKPPAS